MKSTTPAKPDSPDPMQRPAGANPEIESDDDLATSEYRDCAIRFLSLFEPALTHVLAAKNTQIGRCQILFALGLEERSMRDAAASLCVDVKCISDGARRFVRENDLPIPDCMKSDEACKIYSNSRKERLKP